MPQDRQTLVIETAEQLLSPRSRREFVRAMAIGGTAVFLPSVFAACDDEDDITAPGVSAATLDLSGNRGILNYLYAVEQVQASFYVRVVQESRSAGFNAIERRLIADIRNHEFIHREALRALLGLYRLPELRLDGEYRGTNFRDATSIFETAQEMEDLGLSAYNHAGRYLTDPADVLLIGKISSVEARHSAVIRGFLDSTGANTGKLFAGDDIVDENGLDSKDQPTTPEAVLAALDPFIDAALSLTNPPA